MGLENVIIVLGLALPEKMGNMKNVVYVMELGSVLFVVVQVYIDV
jgi:hypothetical protein